MRRLLQRPGHFRLSGLVAALVLLYCGMSLLFGLIGFAASLTSPGSFSVDGGVGRVVLCVAGAAAAIWVLEHEARLDTEAVASPDAA